MKRIIYFLLGVNILAIGLILNTKSGLGVSAINSVPYSISQMTSLSLGNATFCIYIIFIILQTILLKKIDIKVLLQFPFSLVFSYLLDLYDYLLPFDFEAMAPRFILLFFAIILTALGAYLMVVADIVLNPADGMVNTLTKVTKKQFGLVKNCFDLTMICVTIIICMVVKGYLIGIGIGTIFSAIFIGRCISLYQKYLKLHI